MQVYELEIGDKVYAQWLSSFHEGKVILKEADRVKGYRALVKFKGVCGTMVEIDDSKNTHWFKKLK
jgi:hypothetical protein